MQLKAPGERSETVNTQSNWEEFTYSKKNSTKAAPLRCDVI